MSNTKRLGRYPNVPCNNSNNDNSGSQSHFSELASLYEDNVKNSIDFSEPFFGSKRTSLQKLLAKANKTSERATMFLNKIKSRQLACANRAKSIRENAT